MYCKRRLGWKILYYNTLVCIAGWEELYCREEGCLYCNTNELYCDMRARQGWTVLRYNAQPSPRHGGARTEGWLAGLAQQSGARGPRGRRASGARAAGGRWAGTRARGRGMQTRQGARHGRAGGPAGCALGALSLF